MITALDHIAIAVPDLEAAVRRFLDDFGLHYDGNEIVEAAQTTTAFFSLPETHIELVHPLDGSGPIATYLEKRGAVYIICAFVPMISMVMWLSCETRDISLLGRPPRPVHMDRE